MLSPGVLQVCGLPPLLLLLSSLAIHCTVTLASLSDAGCNLCHANVIRPLDIVCRRTYILPGILSFFLLSSFFFFRRRISELAEPNSTQIGHMLRSKCNLKTHVRDLGYPSPTNQEPKNSFLGRLRNLPATLTAYIFGRKHDVDNQSSALTITRCLLHRPTMS